MTNRDQDPAHSPENQGEGNREAGRRYDEKTQDFVRSGRVDQAARDAAPRSADEASEMKRAEEVGRSHAAEEDPQLRRGGTAGGADTKGGAQSTAKSSDTAAGSGGKPRQGG